MSRRLSVPERVSSLMSTDRKASLALQDRRTAGAASRLSQLSTSSTVSEFLGAKMASMEAELDWIRCYHNGLIEMRAAKLLTDIEFVEQLAPYMDAFRTTSRDLNRLKGQQPVVEEDMEEKVQAKQRVQEPEPGFLEWAYSTTIMARAMSATGKQRSQEFNQSRFRRDVVEYYDAYDSTKEYVWCHILGKWLRPQDIKAAHLVPKSLSGEELSHLFGVGEVMLSDPRNGKGPWLSFGLGGDRITLASTIEDRLDKGTIVIVPVPGEMSAPTRWRCAVLDMTKGEDVVHIALPGPDRITRVRDLDGRELQFKTDNRPARRYLYFRFIISYLNAKRAGNTTMDERVEKSRFWPAMGRYLNKSTLVTLARCVAGSDLPPALIEGHTFETDDEESNSDAALAIGGDLRVALVDSLKEGEAAAKEDTDESVD